VFSDRSKGTDLASHVDGKLGKAASIRYRSRHEGICGLLLLLRVTRDGVSIEVNVKDKSLRLCDPIELLVNDDEGQ
jgi:hypothetical protein